MQRTLPISLLMSAILALASCTGPLAPGSGELSAQDVLIIDTHIDVPFRVHKAYVDVSEATDGGDFDYPRAQSGGLDAAFMSIYIPAVMDAAGEGLTLANSLIAGVEKLAIDNPDKFVVATCPSDVVTARKRGLIALPMGMENGGPIRGDLGVLQDLFEKGIRYITLAHSKSNSLSDSSYDVGGRPSGGAADEPARHHGRRVPPFRRCVLARDERVCRAGNRLALFAPPLHTRLGAQHE